MSQIHQQRRFDAPPARVYRALTDAAQFAEWTRAPAQIDATDGGEFVCFGTFILGRNLELRPVLDGPPWGGGTALQPCGRIVQSWRVFDWPEGVFSTLSIDLYEDDDGTIVTLDQDGVPEDACDHIDSGWDHKYWEPLRSYLGG